MNRPFKILSLDGGGSRGVYTLGVLFELEKKLGKPLHLAFDAFFGTSTGSIIASLLSLGYSVDEISRLYFDKIPHIMSGWTRHQRTSRLRRLLQDELGEKTFESFKIYTGIVAASADELKPKIFKSSVEGAHGRKASFKPGFGFTIREAVLSSCAAFPLFEPVTLAGETFHFELIDGGFSANNPTLFALIDALSAFKLEPNEVRVLNVGTGSFPEAFPKCAILSGLFYSFNKSFISTILGLNSSTLETITALLLKDVPILRISETFSEPSLKTSLLESNPTKLKRLYERGRESFGKHEEQISKLLEGEKEEQRLASSNSTN